MLRFASDLHLSPDTPALTDAFLALLDASQGCEHLYILGDLFAYWLGEDIDADFSSTVLQAMQRFVNRGTPLSFMHGNRDFLLSPRTLQRFGIQLCVDPYRFSYGTHKIVLMHGDTLCTEDIAYQRFRRMSRPSFVQHLIRALPRVLRKKLGLAARKKSKAHQKTLSLETMDATTSAIENAFQTHQATLLIHGHTHQPAIHTHTQGTRIVLGSWEHEGEVLDLHANGDWHLTPVQTLLNLHT